MEVPPETALSTKLLWVEEPEKRGLPHVRLDSSLATPLGLLAPPLRRLASVLAPTRFIIDVGGMGQCGPNTLAMLLGHLSLFEGCGTALRLEVVGHAQKIRRTMTGLCAPDEPSFELTIAGLVEDCMRHWPPHALEGRTASFNLWCELMVLPATWIDFAFLVVSAECFSVAIASTGVDDRGNVFPVSLLEPLQDSPKAWLEVGTWINRHMVAIVRNIDAPALTMGDGAASSQPEADGAITEWASFDWPLRSVQDFERLLKCSHIRPTILIGGEFSAALRSHFERQGLFAISVDPRLSDAGGMHFVGEVQDVGHLQQWDAAYFCPPCFQHLVGDEECLPLKLSDGRAFWGMAFTWWCICFAFADIVVVETADTIAHHYGPPPEALSEAGVLVSEFITSEYGDETCKLMRVTTRGAALPPRSHPRRRTAELNRGPHNYASDDERDRKRSSFLLHPRTVEKLGAAALDPGLRRQLFSFSYITVVHELARRLDADCHPIPIDFTNQDARPTSDECQQYQKRRGAGDGRSIVTAPPHLLTMPTGAEAMAVEIGDEMGDELWSAADEANRPLETDSASDLSDGEEEANRRATASVLQSLASAGSAASPSLVLAPQGAEQSAADASDQSSTELGSRRNVDSGSDPSEPPMIRRVQWAENVIASTSESRGGDWQLNDPGVLGCSLTPVVPLPRSCVTGDQSMNLRLDDHRINLRNATEGACVLMFVCTLLQPLVYAHVNGFTVHGIITARDAPRSSAMGLIMRLVASAIPTVLALAYMIGQYASGCRLFAAPVDFAPPEHLIVRTGAQRRVRAAAGATFLWCTLGALSGTPAYDAAARVVLGTEAFVKPQHVLADAAHITPGGPPVVFDTGCTRETSVMSRPALLHEKSPSALRVLEEAHIASAGLLDTLRLHASDALLEGWEFALRPLPTSELPEDLLEKLPDFSDAALDDALLPAATTPYSLDWVPLAPPQLPPHPDQPSCPSWLDVLGNGASRAEEWFASQLADLSSILAQLEAGVPASEIDRTGRPTAIAIGDEERPLWAQGRVFDCRQVCCRVHNFSEGFSSDLNLDFLRQSLGSFPDQALVSYLVEGARLEADVELQTVLVPHLTSLPLGFESVQKELRRLHDLGWYSFSEGMAFVPVYFNGQGAAARKLEDRYRRTTEGGGPRYEVRDASGLPAISINAASLIPHIPRYFLLDRRPEFEEWLRRRDLLDRVEALRRGEHLPLLPDGVKSKWVKELKPTVEVAMRAVAVLARAAHILGEPLFLFGDDAKDFFNQFGMAAPELWKLNIVFLRKPGDFENTPSDEPGLVFVSEKRLGFGTHGASNIAQRAGDALLVLFRDLADEAEAAAGDDGNPQVAEWRRRRQAAQQTSGEPCHATRRYAALDNTLSDIHPFPPTEVCPQLRLYFACQYTDDPFFAVVGSRRAIRLLREWRRLTTIVKLRMAVPEKRSLGCWSLWLGVLFFASLGLVVVPIHKLLRARECIARVLNGGVEFQEYRRLIGLLEHLRSVNLRGRNVMHGLYEPHGPTGASRNGPSGLVRPTPATPEGLLMIQQLQRWQELALRSGGTSVKMAVDRSVLEPPPALRIILDSDACHGDVEISGIGNYCHGMYLYFPVPETDMPLMHAPLLEFLGVCFSILSFENLAGALPSEGAVVLLRTDALTSALTLPRESQKSPVLVEAYQWLIRQPAWQLLRPRLAVKHLFGDANPMSDAISRAKWELFFSLCRAMHVRPHQVAHPPSCTELYGRCVARRRHELEAQRLGRDPCSLADLRAVVDAEAQRGVASPAGDAGDGPPADYLSTFAPATRVCSAGAKGLGLFACRPSEPGVPVLAMSRPKRITKSEWAAVRRLRGLPHDASLTVGRFVFIDASWRSGASRKPRWYYLNHAHPSQANVAPRIVGSGKRHVVEWVTKRPLRAGDELMFDYGVVPSDWNALSSLQPQTCALAQLGKQYKSNDAGDGPPSPPPSSLPPATWIHFSAYEDNPFPLRRHRDIHPSMVPYAVELGVWVESIPSRDVSPERERMLTLGFASNTIDGLRVIHSATPQLCLHMRHDRPDEPQLCVDPDCLHCDLCDQTWYLLPYANQSTCVRYVQAVEAAASSIISLRQATEAAQLGLCVWSNLGMTFVHGCNFPPCSGGCTPMCGFCATAITTHATLTAIPLSATARRYNFSGRYHFFRQLPTFRQLADLRAPLENEQERSPECAGFGYGNSASHAIPTRLGPRLAAVSPPTSPAARSAVASSTFSAMSPSPSTARPRISLLSRVAAASSPITTTRPATPRHVLGLTLPPQPPPPPLRKRTATSTNLATAGRHYARQRLRAMAEGGGPMAFSLGNAALDELADVMHDSTEYGTNANTAVKDEKAWLMWEYICARHQTSPLRTAEDARLRPERNAHLLAVLMLHAFAICKPRAKGAQFIKPRSALAYALAIVRIFSRWGVTMPSYKQLKAALAHLSRLYLAYHGPYSLAPRRAEPMKYSMVLRMAALNNVRIGHWEFSDANHDAFMVKRLACVMWCTAFRLGEIVYHPSGEIMFLTYESLSWSIGGVIYTNPTRAQLNSMRPGVDFARLAPPRAKPDQWGEIHCPFSATLTLHEEPGNAAAALRELVLRRPVPEDERATTPLFHDETYKPYTHAKLDSFLKRILTFLFGKAVASVFTWHSFRSGLATALHAAGVPDAMVQLICRWMCPESLHVYRRMGTKEHEVNIRKAMTTNVDSIQSANVPRISADQGYAQLVTGSTFRAQREDDVAYKSALLQTPTPPSRPPPRSALHEPPVVSPALVPLTEVARDQACVIPSSIWPDYICNELGGVGWAATVVSYTSSTAVVRFSAARTRDGRPYEDHRLPRSVLCRVA